MRQRSFCATFAEQEPASLPQAGIWLKKTLGALALCGLASLVSAQTQDLAEILTSVETYLQEHYQATQAVKVEITLGKLDSRLQLSQCESPLNMKLNDPGNLGGNQTVHTRCDGASPWSIYVPAQIALYRQLPVASRNLERGDIVTQADVVIEVVNISQMRQGQLEESALVIGQEVKRPIGKGEPFRSAALDSPLVIKRGDPVVIELQAGSLVVTTHGTAMTNGRIGERIRVRNSQSDRIISVEVVEAGKVVTII